VTTDHRLFTLGDEIGKALSLRLDAYHRSPHQVSDARNTIRWWCSDVADALAQSSRFDVADEAVSQADPDTHAAIMRWLEGEWSTSASLIDLAWRLHGHPTLISALEWLFDQADTPSRPRRKSVARPS
jgi:hypothetical protein